jgi:YHS domain-containing protein
MSKHFFIFLGTFVVGALVALTVRAARHNGSDHVAPTHATHEHTTSASEPKTQNSETKTSSDVAPAPVNSVCAICGMEVDPDIPTADYQGKTVGFGCKACPPKFKANPDKYGPAALRNEIVE